MFIPDSMKQESIVSTKPVPFREITVIIHGPVIHDPAPGAPAGMTRAAVASVRKVMPGAKVLISTWAGSNAEGLGADAVVYSPDPGGVPNGPKARLNNVNRQIVAMGAGLGLVESRWTLKLRSDTMLTSARVLERWGDYRERNPYLRVFKERIVTSAILTCHARNCFHGKRYTPFLFHVNDMIQFGLTEDMRRLWCIPLMPREDFSYFTEDQLRSMKDNICNRRVPEDYIWTAVLSAAGFPINDSWADFRPAMVPVSELSIVNNFILLDHHDMGFTCLKYPRFGSGYHLIASAYFSHREWRKLYRTHCDPAASVPLAGRQLLMAVYGNPLAYLDMARLVQLLKSLSRPTRYRIKAIFRGSRNWK